MNNMDKNVGIFETLIGGEGGLVVDINARTINTRLVDLQVLTYYGAEHCVRSHVDVSEGVSQNV